MRSDTVEYTVKQQICSFVGPITDKIDLHIVDVQLQENSYDCGVYALAFATELAFGFDPAICLWDHGQLREHLLLCLESRKMARFPVLERWSLSWEDEYEDLAILCVCRMPNDTQRGMIKGVAHPFWMEYKYFGALHTPPFLVISRPIHRVHNTKIWEL